MCEIDFFGGIKLPTESADLPEGGRLDEDKGTGHETSKATDCVPECRTNAPPKVVAVHADGGSTRQNPARLNRFNQGIEEFDGRLRVGIDEQQPVAGRYRGSRIAGAGDHVDGLKDDLGSVLPGNVRGGIRRVVVADNNLRGPLHSIKGSPGRMNSGQSAR